MKCQKCNSQRIVKIQARAKDMHEYTMVNGTDEEYTDGYAGIFCSDGDTTDIDICLDCGQVQEQFPMPVQYFEDGYIEE